MCGSVCLCDAREAITTADLRGQICERLWHFAVMDAEYLSVWRHEAELGRCYLLPVYFRAKLCPYTSGGEDSAPLSISHKFQVIFSQRKVFMSIRVLFSSQVSPPLRALMCMFHANDAASLLSAWHRLLFRRVTPLPTEHEFHSFYQATNQTDAGGISRYLPSLMI